MPKGRSSRSWKMERAAVNKRGASRARTNKYGKSDVHERPEPRSGTRVWVGGYTRSDGTPVGGYYRSA